MALAALTTTLFFAQTNSKDQIAVRSIITTLENGWNNKSGKTFSSVFADVHDYIGVDGRYFSNFTKKGNEVAHQGLFDGVFKNRIIKLKVDKVTFFRKDLAQIIAIGANYEKGGNPPEDPGIIMTVIAEKKNNVWKVISFHNHGFNAEEIKQRGVPLMLYILHGIRNNQKLKNKNTEIKSLLQDAPDEQGIFADKFRFWLMVVPAFFFALKAASISALKLRDKKINAGHSELSLSG